METELNSIQFQREWYESFAELDEQERLAAYEAVFNYAFRGEEPENRLIRIATKLIFSEIDSIKTKTAQIKQKRIEAGRKGGVAKQANLANATKCYQKLANLANDFQEKNKTKKEEIPPHPPIEEKNKTKKEESLGDKTSLSPCQFDKQTDLPNVTPENENINWGEIVLFFNEKVKNKSIPPIKLMTDRRKQAVRARIREYGFGAIKTAIINAAQSEFMNGRNRKNWTATFDWIFLPNNFPKVLEDNYKNKYNAYGTGTTGSGYISRQEQQEQERLERQRSAYRLMQRLAAEDGGDPLPPLEQ